MGSEAVRGGSIMGHGLWGDEASMRPHPLPGGLNPKLIYLSFNWLGMCAHRSSLVGSLACYLEMHAG